MATSKPVQIAFVALVSLVLLAALASLALNIVVFIKYRDEHNSKNERKPEAAKVLLKAIYTEEDPCEDFYSFSCGTYISHAPEGASTFFEAQVTVNTAIAKALEEVEVNKADEWSLTERITKAAVQSCRKFASIYEEELLIDLSNWFGAIPFLNHTLDRNFDVFEAAGSLEATRGLGTLMEATISIDAKNTSRNILYISQPSLPFPRDWYLLPQYSDYLMLRLMLIRRVFAQFAMLVLDDPTPYDEIMDQAAENVAKLERDIAMASWPDTEMRDFSLQYNAYNLTELMRAYPAIEWQSYLDGFLLPHSNESKIAAEKIVLTQPSYFGWLNSLVKSTNRAQKANTTATIVNYMITQILFEEADFIAPYMKKIAVEANYVPYVQRRGHGTKKIGRRRSRRFDEKDERTLACVDLIMTLMPYGPGYVYLKSLPHRDQLAKDTEDQVKLITERFVNMTMSLEWMSMTSRRKLRSKATAVLHNIGWPTELFGDFSDSSVIDAYHEEDYGPIIEAFNRNQYDFYTIKHILQAAFVNREAIRLLTQIADRKDFLMSPAMVNAWYQPDRNSLTVPAALWNSPFYNQDYPKAYNFAGLGTIAGHELVHGFDDEGVQYDKSGELLCKDWNQCGWMDRRSKKGFRDMAQCVVTQYSTQCCPVKEGYVHCANGATTQGENIADIGGVQATYQAYLEYMKKRDEPEKRLPGLEQYTPNQLFWMFYANHWCSNDGAFDISTQLMVDPHSPSSCRVNQVLQDIPGFGQDFGCKMSQKLFPTPDYRCKVWVMS